MNPKIRIVDEQILSDNWYILKKITYMSEAKDGSWQSQSREAYDRGTGLPFCSITGSVKPLFSRGSSGFRRI
ncbi:hypothetical protein LJK88_08845 [Paenibacillus sp. P26]|nr:hypothetical protein LJK88_08845 [Paenibacillus sp. P26]